MEEGKRRSTFIPWSLKLNNYQPRNEQGKRGKKNRILIFSFIAGTKNFRKFPFFRIRRFDWWSQNTLEFFSFNWNGRINVCFSASTSSFCIKPGGNVPMWVRFVKKNSILDVRFVVRNSSCILLPFCRLKLLSYL